MANYAKTNIGNEGRVELHEVLGLTGAEVSVNKLPAGAGCASPPPRTASSAPRPTRASRTSASRSSRGLSTPSQPTTPSCSNSRSVREGSTKPRIGPSRKSHARYHLYPSLEQQWAYYARHIDFMLREPASRPHLDRGRATTRSCRARRGARVSGGTSASCASAATATCCCWSSAWAR